MSIVIVVKREGECASKRLPPDSTRNCNEKSIAEIGLNPSHCDKLDSTEPPILALEMVLRSPAPGLLRKLRLKLKHILALFRQKIPRQACVLPKHVLVPFAAIAILQASSPLCNDDADYWSHIDGFCPAPFSMGWRQHQCRRLSHSAPPLRDEVCSPLGLFSHFPMMLGALLCCRHAASFDQDFEEGT